MSRRWRLPSGVVLLLLLVAAALCPGEALAASQLKCLEQAKGKILVWNPVWGKDNLDRAKSYKVTAVEVKRRPPNIDITLSLKAVGKAAVSSRRVTISAEDTARRFCENLHREQRGPTLPMNPDMEEDKAGLPFIEFSNRFGWVRSYPPKGQRLVECLVRSVAYSCLEKEKQIHGAALEIVEEELMWMVEEERESEQ